MEREKKTESPMLKLARFIVDKRKAFYLIFLASFLFCAVSISKVHVNDDITTYLPAHTETRRGLTLMDEEFITLGSANIMVSNITYDAAYALSLKIEKLPGVSSVEYDDTQEHYHDSAALFTVSFDGEEDDPDTAAVLLQVEQLLDGHDYYPSTTVGRDESASLQQEMTVILAIAAVVIVVVLLFTSKSYMEVPVYLIVFSTAAVLNMGTNFIFGTISFITNSIAIVLQLAMAIDYAIIFCHRYMEERDKGVVNLTGEQADKVDDLKEQLDIGLEQLRGENWTRMVFVADVPTEGAETQALLSQIRSIAQKYYGDDVLLVGNSTNALDLANSFTQDNMKISILTVLFVMVILLFTFKSAGLPILLVLTIQGSIWINFTVPVLTHTNLYFLSYLVVSSIQMGATIDYAIVITNRYLDLKTQMDHRQAAVEALDQSFSTILTSGTIMSVAGFLIGGISTNATIGSVGLTLGRGTVTSIVLVMTVLPQLLMLGDALIERTAITLNRDRKQRFNQGTMRLDGHIRGHVSGFVDGEFKGVLHGSVDALIESKYQQLDLPDTGKEDPHETV